MQTYKSANVNEGVLLMELAKRRLQSKQASVRLYFAFKPPRDLGTI